MAYIQMSLIDYLETRRSKLPAVEKYLKESNHRDILVEALSSMFVRQGLPEDLDGSRCIEEWLLIHGAVAYVRPGTGKPRGSQPSGSYKRSEYRVGWATFGGDPYPDGIGSEAIVHGYDGYVETFEDWRHNDNIVVAFNNQTYTPDLSIPFTANYLTDYDTSLKFQIFYSRLMPIPAVDDDKTLAAVQEALDTMQVGRLKAILSKNILSKALEGQSGTGIDIIQLSDPKASDHIQYLDHGRDDVLRWFWRQYGMDIQGTSKMAQQTMSEVQSGDNQSMIIPHERYHQRQKEAADLKRVFGWDVSIEFSEPWQNAWARCQKEEAALDDREMDNGTGPDNEDSGTGNPAGTDEPNGDGNSGGNELDRNDN